MWNYKLYSNDNNLIKKFGKYSLTAGIIFVIVGVLAMIYPFYTALTTSAFVSWFMIFAGIAAGYFTLISDKNDWWGWLKAFILIGVGFLILLYPATGVETVGLLLAIYLFIDGFSSFALASLRKPQSGWLLWLFNGFISIFLAIIFIVNSPFINQEMWLVGIYVGISIFMDGFVLIALGLSSKKIA